VDSLHREPDTTGHKSDRVLVRGDCRAAPCRQQPHDRQKSFGAQRRNVILSPFLCPWSGHENVMYSKSRRRVDRTTTKSLALAESSKSANPRSARHAFQRTNPAPATLAERSTLNSRNPRFQARHQAHCTAPNSDHLTVTYLDLCRVRTTTATPLRKYGTCGGELWRHTLTFHPSRMRALRI
jgi:hypothetical protein